MFLNAEPLPHVICSPLERDSGGGNEAAERGYTEETEGGRYRTLPVVRPQGKGVHSGRVVNGGAIPVQRGAAKPGQNRRDGRYAKGPDRASLHICGEKPSNLACLLWRQRSARSHQRRRSNRPQVEQLTLNRWLRTNNLKRSSRLVPDALQGEAHQNPRERGEPRLCRISDGRGRDSEKFICRHPETHRGVATA